MEGALRAVESQDAVSLAEALELSRVENDVSETFTTDSITQLLGRLSFLDPAGKRVLMEGIGRKGCAVEVKGA